MTDKDSAGTEAAPAPKKSGNLMFILICGVILTGGVWGMRTYLDAIVPKGDASIRQQKLGDDAEPEEQETSMEIIAGWFAGEKPSKEFEELKSKKPEEVAFTLDQIMKMSKDELSNNIADLSKKLTSKRANLAPSFGAGTMGGGGNSSQGKEQGEEKKEGEEEEKELSVEAMALPLEVMKQVLSKK